VDQTENLNLARQRIQSGDFAGAEAACRQVLQSQPTSADATYLLGIITLQQNRLPEAVDWLTRAAAIIPNLPDVHANLGHALRGLGRFDEGAAALERAIALKPNYPLALSNLGTVRRAQGRAADAIACYRRAASLQPDFLPAQLNLGNIFLEIGRPGDAAQAFRAAMGVAPHNADAHGGLAAAMEAAGDVAGAIVNYEAVLRRHPNHVNTLVNFSLLLKKQSRPDESIALLRRAVGVNPRSPDAQEKLGRGLWDAGFYEEGLSHFNEAIRLRPSPVARVNTATLIPPIYTSLEQVQTWRNRLTDEVGKLRRENVTIDLTNSVARTPFYLPYAGLPDREIMREIALLHRPPADAPLPPRRAGEKIRVGFISTLFKDHTIGLWTQGLVEKLPREQFEVIVISAARHDDAVARSMRTHADRHIDLPPALPAARQTILSLNLDVLIYTDLGMEGFTWSLAFSRLARVQAAMWGHPVTSGLDSVDYFISSDLAEAADAEANYTEKLVRLKGLPLYYYQPPPAPERDRAYFNLPADAHLYACLQATFKLHPEFDFVFGEIVRRDPKALILIPKTRAANWDKMVTDRLAATYGGDAVNRIRFIDRVSREDFAALNNLCDSMLAPFPFGAGDTSMVAFAEGRPVVTMPTSYLRGRFTHAMYRAMDIDDCVAATPEEYVEIALRLANDPAWRESVRQKILSRNHVLFENISGVNELADFISTAATR
jgi:predicted O-linked N-acetylglucosamine transferase (SPINDLY family)